MAIESDGTIDKRNSYRFYNNAENLKRGMFWGDRKKKMYF